MRTPLSFLCSRAAFPSTAHGGLKRQSEAKQNAPGKVLLAPQKPRQATGAEPCSPNFPPPRNPKATPQKRALDARGRLKAEHAAKILDKAPRAQSSLAICETLRRGAP
ncbi:hypothetical protein TRVL_10258 [Trypanosoma vivax]|nr:hypothetical protein TRVL_10258 [Trypanosoma vivax]